MSFYRKGEIITAGIITIGIETIVAGVKIVIGVLYAALEVIRAM